MATNQIFQYNGTPITFQIGGTLMVNATQMAKYFGKQPIDWLKTEQSKEFISVFADMKNFSSADLVRVTRGGNDKKLQGTWMHEDVALEFARWLSPAFAIWCNDCIKELLLNGSTAINNNHFSTSQELEEAKGKINYLTSRLDACQMELNYMKGRLESEKELIALRATMEAEKRIAVLEYRLSQSEKLQVRTKKDEKTHAEVRKITPEQPEQKELFPIDIQEPDYAISCRLSKKGDLEKCFPGAMLIGEMCKRIKKQYNIYIKSGEVFVWLRRNGFLSSQKSEYNKPSAECMKNRWIVYRRQRGINERGYTYCTPYITPEGYTYFSTLIAQKKGGAK